MDIRVIKRQHGCSASLNGAPSFVGVGATVDEALGHFVRCNRDMFTVMVEERPEPPRGAHREADVEDELYDLTQGDIDTATGADRDRPLVIVPMDASQRKSV